MYPVIDSHVHVYPDKIAEKAAEGTGGFYGIAMRYNGTVSQYREESRKVGVVHSVIFSVATTPKQVHSINNFIARTVESEPDAFTGLGTMHPDVENYEEEIAYIKQLGLKGIKLHPDIQGFALDDERCMKIYELCEKYGLILLLHTGDERYDYSNPDRLTRVLKAFPKLTVIAAHFGGWSVWKQAGLILPDYANLYVDCSSSLAFLTPDEAAELIYRYGSERVLWGSDYPMWDYGEEMRRFEALLLDENERANILYKNAQKLFGITLKSV